MEPRETLLYLSLKYQGDVLKMIDAIHTREDFDNDEAEAEIAKIHCPYVTVLDPEYPQALIETHCYPLVLFYRGNLSLVNDHMKCVTIVGSRACTEYGKEATTNIASEIARRGYTVVSGLARGIDTAANRGALPYGKSVAVLGNGIDYYYPSENSALQRDIGTMGLLLSEYPPTLAPSPESFPRRNRILAGLSGATILGGASGHSGTLITAAYALNYNRDLGCIPYRIGEEDSAGNAWIKTGASLIENADDVELMLSGTGHQSVKAFPQKSFEDL